MLGVENETGPSMLGYQLQTDILPLILGYTSS